MALNISGFRKQLEHIRAKERLAIKHPFRLVTISPKNYVMYSDITKRLYSINFNPERLDGGRRWDVLDIDSNLTLESFTYRSQAVNFVKEAI